ncbi:MULTISPECIES: hypothetical protein [unclassified Curtobacterium]|uniref:hypothetical protein n=1 Tax=unclassified Curtobacterium TaxID=257496 RepID=UPI000DA85131|nr:MULTISPECIES: hypothetical protein [unclassified Curtobacterium]PZE26542.1 hypothetical protein DEI86_08740 [Curtobacterium sp. MCBD17_028]PZE74289.1 hypothetical protein DEI82_11415 [Curtobacterium sp. MCBD17_019]PZF58632.1 hypothetical protein DEI92_11345 [Curtobacterium sp. MCBD17_034]PZF64319.1 hypothetical protein DEI81_04925 [Curtobacterium sp. MCBD17_013]PZM34622.1 hypothetical protein DEI90_07915 [Curtobacterium sp. MCBD17_031]
MRSIDYSDAHVLTGDAIADAVVDYAAELAHQATAEPVRIPARAADGSVVHVSLLVGPASEIVLSDVPDADGEELVDDETVTEIRRRIMLLREPQPITTRLEDIVAPGDEEV